MFFLKEKGGVKLIMDFRLRGNMTLVKAET